MIISGNPGVRGRGMAINPTIIRIDPVTTLAAWTTLSILSRYPIPVRRKWRLSVISQLAQRETGINASVIYPQLIIRFAYAAPFEPPGLSLVTALRCHGSGFASILSATHCSMRIDHTNQRATRPVCCEFGASPMLTAVTM